MTLNDSDTILKVALSMTRGATSSLYRHMEDCGVSLRDFFELDTPELSDALSINKGFEFDRYMRDEALFNARKEGDFMCRHHIKPLFISDDDYPWRMSDIADAPLLIYSLGDCEFNREHLISMVGTRRASPYGIDFCKKFINDLTGYFPDVVIVSGLAYGIDAASHCAALDNDVPTIAVMAHGLNTIYPASHRDLARRIIKSGGALISEYPFGTAAYRQRFLERNRIVSAISDAIIIVESEIKGGAMSTAAHAFNYSRDVFALPGRINDPMSAGCNHLIRRHKASLITCAADLIEVLGWRPLGIRVNPRQRCLFPELEGDSKKIYDYLRFEEEPRGIDAIHLATGVPVPSIISLLSEMEFDAIIMRHPGNRFSIAT